MSFAGRENHCIPRRLVLYSRHLRGPDRLAAGAGRAAWPANYPTVLQRTNPWTMPEGDTILDVDNHVLAEASCRLPTSQPALDAYDQALVNAAPDGEPLLYPSEPTDDNDGYPGRPELIYPLNQALDVSTSVTLTWAASDETDTYFVYIGESNPPTSLAGTTTDTSLEVLDLSSNTQYYWRVFAGDVCDETHLTGSVVRTFTTGS